MWGTLRFALLLAGVGLCLGVKFQVYKDFDHRGLISDMNVDAKTGECYNLKPYAQGTAGSVKTDTCLIAFEKPNCPPTSYSSKIIPSIVNLNKDISSFKICDESLGGKTIRTDMYNTAGVLAAEYLDVCGCQDLPTQVSTVLQKLDNYGNCVTVWELNNCRGQSKEIEAGNSALSQDLRTLGYRVRSVSACGARPSCVKLESKIYKFDLEFPEEEPQSVRNVDLATKTKIYNNGSATVTQQYHASKRVRQTYTVSRSHSVTEMESRSTEHNFETNAKAGWKGFGFSVSTSVSYSLNKAYSYNRTEETSFSDTYETEEEKEFSVIQTFEIPPCVEYEVSSTLQILENVEIPYWLYAKVRGTSSGIQLLASELRDHVIGMEFYEEYDDYTAIFRSKHAVQASVGVDTWITGEGSKIENCAAYL